MRISGAAALGAVDGGRESLDYGDGWGCHSAGVIGFSLFERGRSGHNGLPHPRSLGFRIRHLSLSSVSSSPREGGGEEGRA